MSATLPKPQVLARDVAFLASFLHSVAQHLQALPAIQSELANIVERWDPNFANDMRLRGALLPPDLANPFKQDPPGS